MLSAGTLGLRRFAAADAPLRRTPLYDAHLALGGKMVPFGGWEMPVQYDKTEKGGILKSHLHTREAAGIFDVSHMLGVVIRGADRVECMEKLCVADLQKLPAGMGSLSVITNAEGGIIENCINTNAGERQWHLTPRTVGRDIDCGGDPFVTQEDRELPSREAHLTVRVRGKVRVRVRVRVRGRARVRV